MRSLHDKRVVLNQSTIDHSIILPTTAFIDRHLAIGRLTKTDYDDLVVHVLVRLKQSKTIKKGRWDKTRIDFRLEDETFAHLQPIADEIHDLCLQWDKDKGKLGKATARMKYDSSRPMCCEYLEEDRLKTNAHFFLVESSTTGVYGDRAPLVDLTSVGRFRKFVNNRAETEFDIVAAASLILQADECRRSMTAFTVEGNKMSFWHFSRSHIAISDYFDYHKKPKHFIRFIIFMTFASRSELGYDPTVTRAHDASGRLQYQFRIGDKIYQTLRTLAELQKIDIIYKAPRVWAVTELHAVTKAPIGETMVLKDFWHDAGAKSELEIQTEIFDALRKLDEDGDHPAGSLAEDARKFFLHIVSDAPVQVNGVDDTAPAPNNGSTLIHYAAAFEVHDMPQPPSTPHHTTKIHQRIIFAEECQSMYDLSKYSDVALAMAQLIQGLYFMRLAKYLHHDISPGNCLFHVAPDGRRQLKISDLEFAQPYDAPFNETGVTGTPGFMAVEYEHGRHLFTRYIQRPKVFFRYNFAHDLEAALWIYVWFIFTKVPDCLDSKASAQCRSDVQCCRDELLEVEKSLERSAFVRGDITSQESAEAVSALYNKVPEGACIVSGLKSFDVLALLYKSVEATEPLDVGVPGMTRWDPKSFYHRHYTFLQEQFMDIHHRLAKVGYRAISHRAFERAAAPRVEKRGREDSEDEEEEEEREVAAKKLCVRPDGGETDVQSPATGVQPD